MAEKFVIKGGKIPNGKIEVMGAKNATLPILSATLLTKEPCIIDNVPLIEDVFRMMKILEEMGAEISWLDKRKVKITCKDIDINKIPKNIIGRFRGSVLLWGSLLARFSDEIILPPPGGCLIGARSLDTHIDAFKQLGVEIMPKDKTYSFRKKAVDPHSQNVLTVSKMEKPDIFEVILKEFSVTATENVLLYSASNPFKTVIKIADLDYQIQELINVLRKMGTVVSTAGLHSIEIEGKENLKGFEHSIISDPIETGTFIAMALATGGDVTIEKAELSYLDLFLKRLKDFGADFEILRKDSIRITPSKNLVIDKIQSLPYPGIHTDLQPELGVLATQTEGQTLIHDPLYEGRLHYLEQLNKMGAKISYYQDDPHRAIISGPTKLKGINIPTPDLRAGAALVIAGLIADGETVIENIYQIDRGYEKIEERLQKLGLDIKRISD